MKLTKYKHACVTIELDGQAIVIDPGSFSDDFLIPDNLLAVVLTHQHPDHAGASVLQDIVRRYPQVQIFSAPDHQLPHDTVSAITSESHQVGPFKIRFFGGKHAVIDESIPRINNVGVIINDLLCYPGDSFADPKEPVDTLLLPVAAPWMKISDALSYVRQVRPRHIIPTHDAILSEAGQGVVDRLVGDLADNLAITYRRLPSGESMNITPTEQL